MFPAVDAGDDEDADWKGLEGAIRKLTISLIGAAAVAASVLLVRQQKQLAPRETAEQIPPGETTPAHVSLDRLRELGL